MQRAEGESALRQVGIDLGNPKGQHARLGRDALQARQQPAQLGDDPGARLIGGYDNGRFHCVAQRERRLEQNKNTVESKNPLP